MRRKQRDDVKPQLLLRRCVQYHQKVLYQMLHIPTNSSYIRNDNRKETILGLLLNFIKEGSVSITVKFFYHSCDFPGFLFLVKLGWTPFMKAFGVRLGFPGKEFLCNCNCLFDFQIAFNRKHHPKDIARFFLMISRVFDDL